MMVLSLRIVKASMCLWRASSLTLYWIVRLSSFSCSLSGSSLRAFLMSKPGLRYAIIAFAASKLVTSIWCPPSLCRAPGVRIAPLLPDMGAVSRVLSAKALLRRCTNFFAVGSVVSSGSGRYTCCPLLRDRSIITSPCRLYKWFLSRVTSSTTVSGSLLLASKSNAIQVV